MMIQTSDADIPIFWVVLFIYLGVLLAFGLYSKRKTKSVEDYLVAGRNVGPVLLGLSFGVTYFSSVLLIGGGGQAFKWGLGAIWVAVLNVLIGIFLTFLFFGRRTKILADQCKAVTIPQLLAFRYQDKNYQVFSGAVIFFFEMIYLVSVYTGLAKLLVLLSPQGTPPIEFNFLGQEVSLDPAYLLGVLLCGIITIFYLVFGGSIGAILSDAFESIVMIIGVLLIAAIGLAKVGGIDGMLAGLNIAENTPSVGTQLTGFTVGSLTTFVGVGGMGLVGFMLVTSFGQWGMPQAISRFFTAKTKRAVKWGLLIACVWASFVSFFAYFNGALANAYWFSRLGQPGIDATIIAIFKDIDMNIPFFLRAVVAPPIAAIFIAAVTAGSMTTEEKVVLVSASGFSQDIYQNIVERKTNQKVPDEKMLKITRLATIVVVIAALMFTLLKIELVLTLCMFAWAAISSTVLMPYVFGLFWKRGTAKGAWVSGIAALATAIVWWVIFKYSALQPAFASLRAIPLHMLVDGKPWPFTITLGGGTGIHEFIPSQIVAIIVFIAVSLKTSPPRSEFVAAVFSGFDKRLMKTNVIKK